jgi:hypothetical protein
VLIGKTQPVDISGAHFGVRSPVTEATQKTTELNPDLDGVTIVDICGRIVLGKERAALRDLVGDLPSKDRRQILFNLAEVN